MEESLNISAENVSLDDPGIHEAMDLPVFFVIVGIGSFGFACSIYSLYLIIHKSVLPNAYGYICGIHSITEGCLLFIFVCWGSVIIMINYELDTSLAGLIIGECANFLYYSSIYIQMLKSINRFWAIVFPLDYRKRFTGKLAKTLILLSLLVSFFQIIPFFQSNCNLYFESGNYMWMIRDNDCARQLTSFIDLGSCFLTLGIAFFCDCITFTYVHFKLSIKVATFKNDVRFFMQAFLTSFFYLNMILSFYVWTNFAKTTWEVFVSTTLIWILCHTVNQFSLVLFIVTMDKKPSHTTPVLSLSA